MLADPFLFTAVREEVEDEGGIMIPELATDKSQVAQTLRELMIEESSRPFKIMRGPLLHVKLVRVSKLLFPVGLSSHQQGHFTSN